MVAVRGPHQEGNLKMKNEFHLAYKTSFNYPIHISSPDSVRAHLNDTIRLISMLPSEWPRLRGRNFENGVTVIEEYMDDDVLVQYVEVDGGEEKYFGYLLNHKYYFSREVAGYVPSFKLLFRSFKEHGLKPMARREWSWEYPSSNPFWYTVVDKDTKTYFQTEQFFDIDGYETHGIDCLADLLAYSYKFVWEHHTFRFVAITDEHEITKRIRKPWLTYLVQYEYGEAPHTTADLSKMVTFLLQKNEHLLSEEEREVLGTYFENTVTLDTLKRLNERNSVLQCIMEAYNHPYVLKPGVDVTKDPLVYYTINHLKEHGFDNTTQ